MLLWFEDAETADSLLQEMPITPSGVLLWGGPCRPDDTSEIADYVAHVADPFTGPSRVTLASMADGVGLYSAEITEDDAEAMGAWFESEIAAGNMRICQSEADLASEEEMEP